MKTGSELKKLTWKKVTKTKNSTYPIRVAFIGKYLENIFTIEAWPIQGGGQVYVVYFSYDNFDNYYQFSRGLVFPTSQSAKKECQKFLDAQTDKD